MATPAWPAGARTALTRSSTWPSAPSECFFVAMVPAAHLFRQCVVWQPVDVLLARGVLQPVTSLSGRFCGGVWCGFVA